MAIRIEAGSEPIPGYKLIDRIGGGGFGEVWKAEAPGGLLKAIKVVYGELQSLDEETTRRAEQELKALKRVQTVRHPYLLSLERYDIIEGRLLIVMELADRNLWDRFRECKSQNLPGIPREELLRYMEESAEVLDLMNTEYQLQHLDVKPQNLFLVHNHAKVADFGLVKDLEGVRATVTGGITPVYAAPETFDGIVTRFCDQYSLAIVYQELLTGQRPFNGTSLQQLIMQHLSATPNLNPLPPGDRPAIGRSLSKKPEQRFPTCMDLVHALRNATEGAGRSESAPFQIPSTEHVAAPQNTSALPYPAGLTPAPPTPAPTQTPATPTTPPTPARIRFIEPEPVVEEPPQLPEVAEITGEGTLFPALVLGLGQKGLEVLQNLRDGLHSRFGAQALPNIRLLYIDTDAESIQAATQGGLPLNQSETMLARLNRPMHYQKVRDGRMQIASWFNPKMLYRIPRNPVTTGMRALGRLALVDNYRTISGRLRAELEACTNPEAMATASRQTQLSLRTNRPRVYVAASLAGGTGSGMFIDVAYICRFLLKQLGYGQAEIIGLLLLPQVDRKPGRALALGNAYAALTELYHFSSGEGPFAFNFDDREGRIKDKEPPFCRTVILPLEAEGNKEKEGETSRLLGDFLLRDLTAPLGRAVDEARLAALPSPAPAEVQSLGIYRITWPRQSVVHRAARRLCHHLARNWINRDSSPIKDAVKTWVVEALTKEEITVEQLIAFLQESCTQALGQPPEAIFSSLVEPLIPKGKKTEPEVPAVLAALGKMEEVVGSPKDGVGGRKPALAEYIEKGSANVPRTWSQKLARLAVCLVDAPDFRIAGAEEAIRQLTATFEQLVKHHESLCKELLTRSTRAHERIHAHLGVLKANPGSRRNAAVVTELMELLQNFPKWRYQSLILRRVVDLCVGLPGGLSDQFQEVNFCRQRLGELVQAFEEPEGGGGTRSDPVPGMCLLPAGSASIDDALRQLLESLSQEDLRALDQQIQTMIEQQFTDLVQICLASANLVKDLEIAMQQQAEAFAGGRLVGTNVVEMLLAQHPQEDQVLEIIANAYKHSAPDLAGPKFSRDIEIEVLARPPGPQGDLFSGLVERALPEVKLTTVDSTDDIVFYRERPKLQISNLEVFGPIAEEAYRQLVNMEQFTPHSRCDIAEWIPVSRE